MTRTRVGDLELFWDETGQGDPVLLLADLGGDHRAWDLVRADLARHHRLILLDNRDAGASDPAPGPYGIAELAADALGVMDHLGIERFHVAGASMGAAIAQQLALQAPARVASLVLLAAWARTDPFLRAVLSSWRVAVARMAPEEFSAEVLPWMVTHRFVQEPPSGSLAREAARRARGACRSVESFQRQVDACLAHDVLPFLPMLRTPTLVLVGEDDILTSPRYARTLAAALARSEVMIVPASGHACLLETPDAVSERLLRFWTRHLLQTAVAA